MMYFELTRDAKYALITQQILKAMTHYAHGDIFFFTMPAPVKMKAHCVVTG